MAIAPGVDQLDGNYHAIFPTANTPLEHVSNSQSLGDLGQVLLRRAPVRHYRCPADHPEVVNFCEAGQNVILNSIGKKGVRLVVAEVFERKHRNALFRCTPAHFAGPEPLIEEKGNHADEHADDQRVEFLAGALLVGFCGPGVFRALDAFGSKFVGPGENRGDREPKREENDDEPDAPSRDFQDWKDRSRDLNDEPRDDGIGDGDSIDIAPPKLFKKVIRVHAPGEN